MILDIVFLIVGLVLILGGANFLTDGASAIAKRMGISDLVVGLTVVAFGTSAPELAISVLSTLNGSSELAVGNVVGSNIFNVLMIIGVTALVVPMKIQRSVMINEIPFVILSSAALVIMANSPWLDGASAAVITRVDGLLLLLFFAIFMRYTFSQAKTAASSDPAAENASAVPSMPVWRAMVYVLGGLAALVYGGDRFVAGASNIASALGVSEAVIGLTIVATGTSLPELATSVAAALKGKPGIALGNVIGSNIFNIFLVLGVSSSILPLPLGNVNNMDLGVLMGSAVMFWVFGWAFGNRTITRIEGAVLVLGYVSYITALLCAL